MVPIITKAELAAENEMIRNFTDPRQMRGLINRWMEDYPKLELGKLSAEVQLAIIAKYEIAEKLSAALNKLELLSPGMTFDNDDNDDDDDNDNDDDITSTTDSGYAASPSSLAPITPPRVPSNARSSSNPTRPRVLSSAGSISPIRPIASNPTYPTTPTRWSKSKKMVSRRIINDSIATRSSVLTKSRRTPRESLQATTSGQQATTSTPMRVPALPHDANNDGYTLIGPNGTILLTKDFNTISFSSPIMATRNLLDLVFSEEVLAKNSINGKVPSVIRKRGRPPKGLLNPDKVADVIHCITSRTNCSEYDVRCAITTKCADSAKKLRRLSKIPESQN
uniref:BEN domain-containing protein n=1 Tax=Bactrocera dorsalis TaxID=27457 RepID=A0A034VI54_BACDO